MYRRHAILKKQIGVFVFAYILSLFATIFLPSAPIQAAAARQNSLACSNTGATTIACTITAPTNGNFLVAVIGTRGTTANRVSSITHTGATWQRASQATNANGITVEIWYAMNVSSAGTSVTINLAATLKASAVIAEYSGIETTSALDVTANTTGNSTSPSTGTTATTAQASELWIGGMANIDTSTYSAQTNSFTEVAESASTTGPGSSRNNTVFEERIVSSTGTATVGATLSGTQQWAGTIATFKAIAEPTQIAFTTTARTVTAGTCSGAGNVITIQLQNGSGTPTNPTGATTVRITSNSTGTFSVYSDSSCSTQLTNGDISFTTSENTKSFYVIDTRKSNPTHQLTATKQSGPDTISSANQNITVNAGAVTRLVITLPGQTFTDGTGNSGSPSNRTAGSSFAITSISATDDYFNVNTGYSGAQTLAYSGPSNAPDTTAPTYTTAVSFTSGQSTTTLTTTLYNAESTTITATDGGSYGYASSSVTVNPGILQNYLVTASTPSIAGTCVSGNSITARDDWNNNRSTDTSTVNMTSNGTSITFYTDGTCGVSTSQYTLSGGTSNFWFDSTLKQTGFTVTATEDLSTPTGTSGSLTIDPAAANAILVQLPGQGFTDGTGITGSPTFSGTRAPNATAGTSFTVNLKAVDQYNNLVDTGTNNYTGSKTIDWSNSTAGNAPDTTSPSFPGAVSFTNGEANTLSITYYLANTGRRVRADDTVTPVTGTASSSFEVQADVVQNYRVTPAAASQTAGVAFDVTITARDDWENTLGALYAAPAGSYTWSTNATNAPDTTAPSIGTLVQGDFSSGVATKSVTLYKSESGVTFTAQEPSAGASGTSTITVTTGVGEISAHIDDSSVAGAASVAESVALPVTITLLDTWENPISGVAFGNITLSGTGSPTINQPSSNTDANGQTTGDLTWATAGSYTVSVQISTVSLVQNDGSTADADGFLDDTHSVNVTAPIPEATLQGGTIIRGGTRIE